MAENDKEQNGVRIPVVRIFLNLAVISVLVYLVVVSRNYYLTPREVSFERELPDPGPVWRRVTEIDPKTGQVIVFYQPMMETSLRTQKIQGTSELTKPSEARLNVIYAVAGILIFWMLISLVSIYVIYPLKNKAVPKRISDSNDKLLAALAGLLIGFVTSGTIEERFVPPQSNQTEDDKPDSSPPLPQFPLSDDEKTFKSTKPIFPLKKPVDGGKLETPTTFSNRPKKIKKDG